MLPVSRARMEGEPALDPTCPSNLARTDIGTSGRQNRRRPARPAKHSQLWLNRNQTRLMVSDRCRARVLRDHHIRHVGIEDGGVSTKHELGSTQLLQRRPVALGGPMSVFEQSWWRCLVLGRPAGPAGVPLLAAHTLHSVCSRLELDGDGVAVGIAVLPASEEDTAQAVLDAGLRLDIQAPVPAAPSMTMALEQYIKKANKG